MNTSQLSHLSDQQLVVLFQEGEKEAAFQVLYTRYAPAVTWGCYQITGRREEAMDISSEVFVKVFQKLHTLRESRTFRSWLFRIARNLSINSCLKLRREHCLPLETIRDMPEQECSPQEYDEKEAEMSRMQDALFALPPDAQALLTAKYLNGDSIQILMERYQLSKSAVKMRLARARLKANDLLARA